MFPKESFRDVLVDRYVEARLHNDEFKEGTNTLTDRAVAIRELQEELVGHFALPYYMVMDPETREILGEHTLALIDQEAKLLDFLDSTSQQSAP